MTLQQEVQLLRQVPLFAKIDPARLKLLAFTSDRLVFAKDDVLFRQGEPGDAAYLILSGAAEVSIDTMRAWGCGLRSSLHQSIRGSTMSSAKSVWPATLPGASVFGRAVPMTA